MRNSIMSKLPLNDDILDRILAFSSTTEDLASLVLTSKSFHEVYQIRPDSIVRKIAWNITGEALPQALRYVRWNSKDSIEEGDRLEEDEMTETPIITKEEMTELKRFAGIVKELEGYFSLNHKDHKSLQSRLSSEESYRFSRACYRIMLFNKVFTEKRFEDEFWYQEDSDWDNDDDDETTLANAARKQRKQHLTFLQGFDTEGLLEIWTVVTFVGTDLLNWMKNAAGDLDSEKDLMLAGGLERVLRAIKNQGWSEIIDGWDGDTFGGSVEIEGIKNLFSDPLTKICETRQVKTPQGDEIWKCIIQDVVEQNDPCAACDKAASNALWGPSNWGYLPGSEVFSPGVWTPFLKGRLPNSYTTTVFLHDQYHQLGSVPAVLEEMFDVRKQPDYAGWNKNDWLCTECLKAFIRDNLHLWLLERRRRAGNMDLEDCWYGYNCRTQIHKLAHAQKLNHWCEQTRGS